MDLNGLQREWNEMKAKNKQLREALEKIAAPDPDGVTFTGKIAKEALQNT